MDEVENPVLERVAAGARERGLLVLLDAKRGDIGSTARGYAAAYLGSEAVLPVDAITANPYLGLDALEPFRCEAPVQDPQPLEYLREANRGTYDINLEVHVAAEGQPEGLRVCASNFKHLYWTMHQQLAHL